jgi:hypothetical protein
MPFCSATQVALAGVMPLAVFLAAAAFTAFATGMNLARVQSLSGAQPVKADRFGGWQAWQLGSGLVGLAVVPQVSTWCPGSALGLQLRTCQGHPALDKSSAVSDAAAFPCALSCAAAVQHAGAGLVNATTLRRYIAALGRHPCKTGAALASAG